jgi:hypothetical protein
MSEPGSPGQADLSDPAEDSGRGRGRGQESGAPSERRRLLSPAFLSPDLEREDELWLVAEERFGISRALQDEDLEVPRRARMMRYRCGRSIGVWSEEFVRGGASR